MLLHNRVLRILVHLRARVDAQEGQAMVEYALILGLIAVVSIVVLQAIGLNVSRVFGDVNNSISGIGT